MVIMFGKTEEELRKEHTTMIEIMSSQGKAIEELHTLADQRQKTIDVRNRAIEDLEKALVTKSDVCDQHVKMIMSQELKINELIKELNRSKTGEALWKSQVECRDQTIQKMTEEMSRLSTGLFPPEQEILHRDQIKDLRKRLEQANEQINRSCRQIEALREELKKKTANNDGTIIQFLRREGFIK